MGEQLKRRIRAHGRRDRRDAFFGDRLLYLADRIERDHCDDERDRLLAHVSRAFDRHMALRDPTQRTRARIARITEDQRMLSDLFALVGARRSA